MSAASAEALLTNNSFKITRTAAPSRVRVRKGVVHVRSPNQAALCETFVRMQEFYESPFNDIRGHYFTLDYFKGRYSPSGPFTYYDDWHGFNVPGHVVEAFFANFPDLTANELMLRGAVAGFDKFYLIGSHEGDDLEDALDHELVHATYYLDEDYKVAADRAVAMFKGDAPFTYGKFYRLLKEWGYDDSTMDDEANAYLATTEEAWWLGQTNDAGLAKALWQEGAMFRSFAAAYRTNSRWL